jgi:hypothetical protein
VIGSGFSRYGSGDATLFDTELYVPDERPPEEPGVSSTFDDHDTLLFSRTGVLMALRMSA